MVGFDIGCRAEGIAPRRLSTTAPIIQKGNARKIMPTNTTEEKKGPFGFKPKQADDDTTTVSTGEPQAYVFLGRDKYRADEQEDGAQGWRRLFLTLAEMAAEGTQGKVTQNTFGLEILYTGLKEIEAQAQEELGDEFEATFEATWNRIAKREAEKADRKARRQAADAAAGQAREEASEEPVEEPVAQPVKQAATRRK